MRREWRTNFSRAALRQFSPSVWWFNSTVLIPEQKNPNQSRREFHLSLRNFLNIYIYWFLCIRTLFLLKHHSHDHMTFTDEVHFWGIDTLLGCFPSIYEKKKIPEQKMVHSQRPWPPKSNHFNLEFNVWNEDVAFKCSVHLVVKKPTKETFQPNLF